MITIDNPRAQWLLDRMNEAAAKLTMPTRLQDTFRGSNVNWWDAYASITALYYSGLKRTDQALIKVITTEITQERLDYMASRVPNESYGGRIFVNCVFDPKLMGELHDGHGLIHIRGSWGVIDLYHQKLQPRDFTRKPDAGEVAFQANMFCDEIAQNNFTPPSKEEAKRIISEGWANQENGGGFTIQMNLIPNCMPLNIYYSPYRLRSDKYDLPDARSWPLLQAITRRLNAADQPPSMKSVGVSYVNLPGSTIYGNSLELNLSFTGFFETINSWLKPEIQDRSLRGHITVSLEEKQSLEQSGDIEGIAEKMYRQLQAEIDRAAALNTKTVKRRKTRKEKDANLKIDQVSLAVLEVIEAAHPGKRNEVLTGKIRSVRLKVRDGGEFFAALPLKTEKTGSLKAITISFSMRDGHLHCIMPLTSEIHWQNDRMTIPKVPEIIAQSLIGRDATEIIDHQISKHLGKVKSTKEVGETTEVRFEKIEERIDG